ncbi:MAG: hypothetical protein GVY09_13845 [Gammaproteobacteria bacterium]|nr:hypothetical protein [Gammaproteobacteria bacterium]
MTRPDSAEAQQVPPKAAPEAPKPGDDAHRRTLGKRLAPDLSQRDRTKAGPTPEEVEWIRAMSNYRTRVPKGVFRYHSHEEANADRERWHAELVAETARQRKRDPGR